MIPKEGEDEAKATGGGPSSKKEENHLNAPSSSSSSSAAAAAAPQPPQQQGEAEGALGWNHPVIWVIIIWIAMLSFRDYSAKKNTTDHDADAAVVGIPSSSHHTQAVMPESSPLKIQPEQAKDDAAARAAAKIVIQPTKRQQQVEQQQYDIPHLMVQYCTSWGMSRNFLELKKFLEMKYPSLIGSIEGGNYPLPPYAVMIVSLVGYLQMATMIMLFAGNKVRLCFW